MTCIWITGLGRRGLFVVQLHNTCFVHWQKKLENYAIMTPNDGTNGVTVKGVFNILCICSVIQQRLFLQIPMVRDRDLDNTSFVHLPKLRSISKCYLGIKICEKMRTD